MADNCLEEDVNGGKRVRKRRDLQTIRERYDAYELRRVRLQQEWGELTGGPNYDTWLENKLLSDSPTGPQWRRRPTTPGIYICYPGLSGSTKHLVAVYLDIDEIAAGAPFQAEWCYGPIGEPTC